MAGRLPRQDNPPASITIEGVIMKNSIAKIVAGFSQNRRSGLYKMISFLCALFLFLILFPIAYLFIGKFINQWFSVPCLRIVELVLAGISIIAGLLFMLWASWTQWVLGRGGPVPVAPTQKLISTGPYACCRNPLHLGALFYCFAFGTFFGNLTVGLVSITLDCLLVVAYVKGVEEKELEIRFGNEYLEYRKNTPFLIPAFRKHRG